MKCRKVSSAIVSNTVSNIYIQIFIFKTTALKVFLYSIILFIFYILISTIL